MCSFVKYHSFLLLCLVLYILYYRTTEQYETVGEKDKPNVYEQIKNKQGKQSNITQSRLKEICLLVCLVLKYGVTLF
jgi:hypothetical protein